MNEKMRVNLAEILPIIKEQLALGKEVLFTPNGKSMLPMLTPGVDSVTLRAAPPKLKKYDVPLYRRDNGQFVLHRVVRVMKDGTYLMCGDNLLYKEWNIRHDQIIGVISNFTHNGKQYSCTDFKYRLYCIYKVMERLFLCKLTSALKKLKIIDEESRIK